MRLKEGVSWNDLPHLRIKIYSPDEDISEKDKAFIEELNGIVSKFNAFYIAGCKKIKLNELYGLRLTKDLTSFSINMSPRELAMAFSWMLKDGPKLWDMAEYMALDKEYPVDWEDEDEDASYYKYELEDKEDKANGN